MKKYIENNFTLGEMILLHDWYYDRSKNTVYANSLIDQMEANKVFTTFPEFIETLDRLIIEGFKYKLESIRSSCDF